MDERWKILGVAAGVTGWAVILAAINLNPWFVFTEHAFSDLGGYMASFAWVFNYGMMLTGLLVMAYGVLQGSVDTNWATRIGRIFTLIAGGFLFLIGRFPSGTSYHFLVSIGFFAQTDLAIGAWGYGLLKSGNKRIGTALLALSIIGPFIAVVIDWPSTAVVEAFGILVMNIWVALMTRVSS